MNSSAFDGNAAFSGGGFMPSQSTQTTDSGFSPASSKSRDSQALLPLTVKQIGEASDSASEKSNLVIDGVDVNTIKLVGMVFSKVERITEVIFSLEDGTGRIECHRWLNGSSETKEMEEILDGMYVRIHGHLKVLQGKRHLLAFSVRPLTNFNEIAYHFAECVYVHIHNCKLQKMPGGVQTQPNIAHSVAGMNGSTGPNQVSAQYNFDGISNIDQMVLDYLNQPACLARERGVHRDEIVQQLKVPLEKILESIKSLGDEGAIYSTIDECHFRSAVNG